MTTRTNYKITLISWTGIEYNLMKKALDKINVNWSGAFEKSSVGCSVNWYDNCPKCGKMVGNHNVKEWEECKLENSIRD